MYSIFEAREVHQHFNRHFPHPGEHTLRGRVLVHYDYYSDLSESDEYGCSMKVSLIEKQNISDLFAMLKRKANTCSIRDLIIHEDAAAYQLGNTSSRTIPEFKEC